MFLCHKKDFCRRSMGKDLVLFPFQTEQMGLQCVMYIYKKIFSFMASLSSPTENRINVNS